MATATNKAMAPTKDMAVAMVAIKVGANKATAQTKALVAGVAAIKAGANKAAMVPIKALVAGALATKLGAKANKAMVQTKDMATAGAAKAKAKAGAQTKDMALKAITLTKAGDKPPLKVRTYKMPIHGMAKATKLLHAKA